MGPTFFSEKSNRILGSLALLMTIFALGMYSQYTWKQAEYLYSGPAMISVSGEGEVTAVPDVGEFSFSVNADAEEAATAQKEVADTINAIVAYLKENGVEEKDIKTEYYNLYPKYRYEERVCAFGMSYCPPGEQVQDGFTVSQSIRVKVRTLDTAGDLIAGAGERGATNLSGLNFTIDDESALKAEARESAIADAKAKAQVLADQLGVRLVRMTGYNENEGYNPYPYYGMGGDMMARSAVAEESAAIDVPAGENIIKSQVTITYEVR
jgi:uncharacterized protein YggE